MTNSRVTWDFPGHSTELWNLKKHPLFLCLSFLAQNWGWTPGPHTNSVASTPRLSSTPALSSPILPPTFVHQAAGMVSAREGAAQGLRYLAVVK